MCDQKQKKTWKSCSVLWLRVKSINQTLMLCQFGLQELFERKTPAVRCVLVVFFCGLIHSDCHARAKNSFQCRLNQVVSVGSACDRLALYAYLLTVFISLHWRLFYTRYLSCNSERQSRNSRQRHRFCDSRKVLVHICSDEHASAPRRGLVTALLKTFHNQLNSFQQSRHEMFH